jgi:ParE toxin of type II toxin-antitoxin system, parDE
MAEFIVEWSKIALNQRRGILKFWFLKTHSKSYSLKLSKLIQDYVYLISINPFLFPKSDFLDIHVCPFGHFSIYYKIEKNEIVILAFWDNRQNPLSLINIINT